MASNVESGTAEAVAYALAQGIMAVERRALAAEPPEGWQAADRKYLLDLYVECLGATNGRRPSEQPRRTGALGAALARNLP